MKYLVLLLLFVAAGVAAATIIKVPPPEASVERQTIVFYDVSALTRLGSLADASFEDTLQALVDHRLVNQGDRISLFLVHAGTRGKANRYESVYDLAFEDETSGSTANRRIAEIRNAEKRQAFYEGARQGIASFPATTQVKAGVENWTDLWGALEVISDEVAAGASDTRVYFLSDMYESSQGHGRRDFHKRAPKSIKEAESWATEDAFWVDENLAIEPERLADVQIRVLLGTHGNLPEAPYVRAYWEKLFTDVGFDKRLIRYN